MRIQWTRNILLASALVLGQASAALAEKVRGTQTCTSGSYPRTIGGKKYTCGTKCTTPVTNTTCTPGGACSTTVSNEIECKDCEAAATSTKFDGIRAPITGGLLDTRWSDGGGRGPSPTGTVAQPPRAAAPVLR